MTEAVEEAPVAVAEEEDEKPKKAKKATPKKK